jgi:hypothetical protein
VDAWTVIVKYKIYYCPSLQECLQDIALALQSGYPTSLHYKLYIRRSQCLSNLNMHKEEVEALQSAQKCLELVEDMLLSKKGKFHLQNHSEVGELILCIYETMCVVFIVVIVILFLLF